LVGALNPPLRRLLVEDGAIRQLVPVGAPVAASQRPQVLLHDLDLVHRHIRPPAMGLHHKCLPPESIDLAADGPPFALDTNVAVAHILVPVDFSERSEPAVRYAVALAGRQHAAITLLYATDSKAPVVPKIELNRLSTLGAGLEIRCAVIQDGDPASLIARQAAEKRADLIVIATRPRRRECDFYLGSVAMRVLETAPVPVICLHADTPAVPPTDRILAAVDLSERSLSPLRCAAELARDFGAALTVAHVASVDRPAIEKRLGELIEAAGVRPIRMAVLQADPAASLLELAAVERPQLFVIGTRPHMRLSDLVLGSVAMRVIPLAPCPVACVRTDGLR
jgi:nucleotide-binding universal stress UspA family protein